MAAYTFFILIFGAELVLFYRFFSRPLGNKAVYVAWYAWIIDLCSIVSGAFFMILSILAFENPWLFNFKIPFSLIAVVFIIGSWHANIHAIKWFLRLRLSRRF